MLVMTSDGRTGLLNSLQEDQAREPYLAQLYKLANAANESRVRRVSASSILTLQMTDEPTIHPV